jgi:nitrogen regulatory protein PII
MKNGGKGGSFMFNISNFSYGEKEDFIPNFSYGEIIVKNFVIKSVIKRLKIYNKTPLKHNSTCFVSTVMEQADIGTLEDMHVESVEEGCVLHVSEMVPMAFTRLEVGDLATLAKGADA